MSASNTYLNRAEALKNALSKRSSDVHTVEKEVVKEVVQQDFDLTDRVADLEKAIALLGEVISNLDNKNKSSSTNVMTRIMALEQRFVDMAVMARNMKRGGART